MFASGGPAGGRTFEKVRSKLFMNFKQKFFGGISREASREIGIDALRLPYLGAIFQKSPLVAEGHAARAPSKGTGD